MHGGLSAGVTDMGGGAERWDIVGHRPGREAIACWAQARAASVQLWHLLQDHELESMSLVNFGTEQNSHFVCV